MKSTTTIAQVDGVRVIVPDSLNLITTYVLREQKDWFEDEIKFLREVIQPGHRVIDIGANYGVYTLTMAKLVGPAGYVCAFEPATITASQLRASITANNFNHVVVEQKALSRKKGTAQLSLNDNSELNALVHDYASGNKTETVNVSTLDECMKSHNWKDIEYVKLDAEGEEENILLGGTVFLATESPLIQYEVKAGAELHLELIQAFNELGYNTYRLVPGLNVLVPFDNKDFVDDYLLNLFSCKPARAAKLAERGCLVEAAIIDRYKEVHFNEMSTNQKEKQTKSWLSKLERLPYGEICSESWRKTVTIQGNPEVDAAMFLYMKSRNASLSKAERFAALEESFLYLKSVCEFQPTNLRLSSLARIARGYGARSIAVNALSQLSNMIFMHRQANPSEPFLAPNERFDTVIPQNGIARWLAAAVLEEFERLVAFSSFYTGKSALQRLEIIRNLGYGSEEMNRRITLIKQRFADIDT
jgi:protein O-GlcNAc transferase